MHVPWRQTSPALQVRTLQVSTQLPLWQVWPVPHATPAHLSTHVPDTHFSVLVQLTPAQGSMQLPAMQAWPAGHTAPLHLATQLPLLQKLSPGQVTPTHELAMQRWSAPQVWPAAQGTQSHSGWQTPPVHT